MLKTCSCAHACSPAVMLAECDSHSRVEYSLAFQRRDLAMLHTARALLHCNPCPGSRVFMPPLLKGAQVQPKNMLSDACHPVVPCCVCCRIK